MLEYLQYAVVYEKNNFRLGFLIHTVNRNDRNISRSFMHSSYTYSLTYEIFCICEFIIDVLKFLLFLLLLFVDIYIKSTFKMPKKRLGKTVFNDDWLLKPGFFWINKGKIETEAFCTICTKTFQLSNMGIIDLKSHVEGSKHDKKILARRSSASILSFTANKVYIFWVY